MNNTDRKQKEFIIFSVYTEKGKKSGYPSEIDAIYEPMNEVYHRETLKELKDLGFSYKELEGCYKGEKEMSIYVETNSIEDFKCILSIARFYDQESVLYVNSDREAFLQYVEDDTKTCLLGKFQQVSKHEALSSEAYTYDYINNGYYICE